VSSKAAPFAQDKAVLSLVVVTAIPMPRLGGGTGCCAELLLRGNRKRSVQFGDEGWLFGTANSGRCAERKP
jgi:uncharacterized membrane protein